MAKLLVGSLNLGKQAELAALLADLELSLITPAEIGLELEIDETGESYSENARLKATQYARASGLWTLSDDTGLEVDLLNGEPGPRSARYAPSAAERRRKLIGRLEDSPRPWKAMFRAVVALASPRGPVEEAAGTCPGEIIPDERGSGGFGYDSVFLVGGVGKTMAELSMEEKNGLSHRAQAVRALVPAIRAALDL